MFVGCVYASGCCLHSKTQFPVHVYTACVNVPFSFQKTTTMNKRNTMLLHRSVKATLLIVCATTCQGTTTVGGARSHAAGELFENDTDFYGADDAPNSVSEIIRNVESKTNRETVSESLLASCLRENGSLHIRSARTVISFAGIHIQPLPGQAGNHSGKQTDNDPGRYETETDSNLSRLE